MTMKISDVEYTWDSRGYILNQVNCLIENSVANTAENKRMKKISSVDVCCNNNKHQQSKRTEDMFEIVYS